METKNTPWIAYGKCRNPNEGHAVETEHDKYDWLKKVEARIKAYGKRPNPDEGPAIMHKDVINWWKNAKLNRDEQKL